MKNLLAIKKADRAGIVGTLTTAELLEWFNGHSGIAAVKKFADRKTAERRVLALLDALPVEKEIDHGPANRTIAKFMKEKSEQKELLTPEQRSAAIASSWKDPAVAAVRAVRDHVIVDGVWYVSVRQAFIDLDLPLNEHVRFRAELKAAKKMKAYDAVWVITKEEGPK